MTPVLVAITVLACLDGFPGINLEASNVSGSFRYTDVCFIVLIAIAGYRRVAERESLTTPVVRAYVWWAVCFVAIWLIAFRNGAIYDGSARASALFGRTFLFFAILGPIAPWLVRTERELAVLVGVLTAGTLVFVLFEIPAALGVISPAVVNPDHVIASGAITRIYTPMGDTNLIDLVFCGAVAVAVLRSGRQAQLAAVIAALTLIGALLLLTRALYVGLAGALIVGGVTWGTSGVSASRVRQRLVTLGSAAAVVLVLILLVAPGAFQTPAVTSIVGRVTTGVANVSSGTGTLQVRAAAASLMIDAVGNDVALGLGFRDPNHYYVLGLPNGNIEDDDVSGLDAFVTMGLAGEILVFMPLAVTLVLAPRWGLRARDRYRWLYLAVFLWALTAALSAPTLAAFESPAGVATSCLAIGLLLRVRAWDLSAAPVRSPSHDPCENTGLVV